MDSWVVGVKYAFQANSKSVLGQATRDVDRFTGALTKATEAVGILGDALRALSREQAGVANSFARAGEASRVSANTFAGANGRIASSFDVVARSAERARVSTAAFNRSAAGAVAVGAGAGVGGAAGHGGGGILGLAAAIAGVGTASVGIKTASDFQAMAAQTAVATGTSTAAATAMFRPIAMAMSNATAQSITDSMGLIRTISTAGFNKPSELLANHGELLRSIANYADTQYLGAHHVPFQESATTAATLAHQLGTRSGPQLNNMLNTLFKISQDMPDAIGRAANQLKYYAPQYTQAGVGASELLQLQATADRLGLGGGRSGTGFRALLQTLQRPSREQAVAQSALGLLDAKGHDRFINERTGVFDVEGFFKYLNGRYDAARRNGTVGTFSRDLAGISSAGAGSVLSLFTSDAGRSQRAAVSATMTRVESLTRAQAQLMDTLNGQTTRLVTNFSSLAGVISTPLIKPLTSLFKSLADAMGNVSDFLQAHPTAQKFAAGGLAAGAIGGVAALFGTGIRIGSHFGIFGGHRWIGGATGGAKGGAGWLAEFGAQHLGDLRWLAGRGGGLVGRAGSVLGGLFERNLPGLVTLFADLGGKMRFAGAGAKVLTFMLGEGLGGIFKLGLRFVPFVGELLLIGDAIRLVGSQAKNIGFALGYVSAWVKDRGLPMFVSALQGLVGGMIRFVADTWKGIFNGHHGGLWDFTNNVGAGLSSGAAAEHAGLAKAPQRTSAANLHRGVVVPHHVAYRAAAMATRRPHAFVNHGSVVNVAHVEINPPTGADFDQIMAHLRRKVISGNIAHSTPDIPTNVAEVTVAGHLWGQG